ncbi:four helix bundle protein [Geobacter sp. AOG1]|uniref:four helix bundle protein n=1 Tax=Geobacter sp. AOG1 TaxID=1566346 RepID=UPI001CC42B60|nr:four helix bundle protein [Geobacter sp. AOG1]GFE57747.1 four helix bundle protein [Geobacter sp. AOG1]
MFKSFKDMPAWQHAIALAEKVHALTDNLPKKEDYGFTSQIRRSALSISANIAEGYGRKHTLDKINFYYNARGSLTETQSHLDYAVRVGYMTKEDSTTMDEALNGLYHEINKIINSLRDTAA